MSSARKWTWVGAAVVLIGIALRIRTFQLNASLGLDESSLALNILSRSFAGLLQPLDYSQGAPILFLWLEKLIVVLTHSSSEFALRLAPSLAGSIACAGFWVLCRRLKLNHAGTLCATALFSFSPVLIDYSGQAKQYSVDVFVAIALYLAAVPFLEKPSRQNSLILGICGLLAIGMSHPAVFVLAGVGATGIVDGWRRHDRRFLEYQLAVVCVWLVGFVFNFSFFLRHLSQLPGMFDYWNGTRRAFMPLSGYAPKWVFMASVDAAKKTGFMPALLLPAALAGGILLWKRDWRIPLMLYLPAVLAMVASAFQRYPFADRMTLFVAPTFFICAGASLSATLPFREWLVRPIAIAIFCVLMYAPAKSAAAMFIYPSRFGREEFRDTFLDVIGSGRCQDHIFVYEKAATQYYYYNRFRWSGKYGVPIVTASQLTGGSLKAEWFPGSASLPSNSGSTSFDSPPCFWLVFAQRPVGEVSSLSNYLYGHGYEEALAIRRADASAHLFRVH
jgi:hypothetical protein